MLPILFLFFLPLILILYFQKHKTKPSQKLHNNTLPPGPPGLPFIGNLHQFDGRQHPHIYLHRLSKIYGPLISMKLGFRQVVVISSANIVREIMKSHDAVFSGRPSLVSMQKLSYNGLDVGFSPYNDHWREMRKISTLHLFNPKRLQQVVDDQTSSSFRHVLEDEVSGMIRKISEDASLSRVTNLSETMIAVTSNTILRVAFGKRVISEDEKSRFYGLFGDIQAMLGGFFVGDYFPWFGWIDRITGMSCKLDKIFRKLDCFYDELIEEHLDSNRPKEMEGDILDIILRLKSDHGIALTTDHVKALMLNIIAGGTDANAATIVWALTALMKNPTIMKKVQAEIRHLAGNLKKESIDENDIPKLPYLTAIIKETFRLYPPAPLLVPRETTQKCSVNGYEIKAKTLVRINAWAIARDPEFWENPDDFWPDRFLKGDDDVIDVRGRDPTVIPFGIGRRGCPGSSMGISTVEIALANLLLTFDWELPLGVKEEDIDFDVLPGMTMHKKNALCLVAKHHVHG